MYRNARAAGKIKGNAGKHLLCTVIKEWLKVLGVNVSKQQYGNYSNAKKHQGHNYRCGTAHGIQTFKGAVNGSQNNEKHSPEKIERWLNIAGQ